METNEVNEQAATENETPMEGGEVGNDSNSNSEAGVEAGGSLLDALDEGEGLSFDFSSGDKPEGFPDEFWDGEVSAPNAQALFEAYKKQEQRANDLRSKLGKGQHKAPKEAGEYKFEVPEGAEQYFGKDDDPVVGMAKNVAHKYGMSQELFSSFMQDMTSELATFVQESAANPPEMTDEQFNDFKQQEYEKIGPNAPAVIRAVESWGREQVSNGLFSESDFEAFKTMSYTGEQIRVLNKLRSAMGGASDVPMDVVDDGLPADQEIADIINKAYESGDEQKVRKAEELLEKRRKAGRPERLAF